MAGKRAKGAEVVVEGRSVPRPEGLLEQIAERSRGKEEVLPLPSGRTVRAVATAEGDVVRIESRTGEVELEITMTDRGPLLRFRAADLALSAAGEVAVDCDRFTVRAGSGIVHETGGDAREVVGGDKRTKVRGTHEALARRTHIESKRGDVRIVANDDVEVVGERVKLNC